MHELFKFGRKQWANDTKMWLMEMNCDLWSWKLSEYNEILGTGKVKELGWGQWRSEHLKANHWMSQNNARVMKIKLWREGNQACNYKENQSVKNDIRIWAGLDCRPDNPHTFQTLQFD